MCPTVVHCRGLHPCLGFCPFCEKRALVIYCASSNTVRLQTCIYMKNTESSTWVYWDVANPRVTHASALNLECIRHLFIWTNYKFCLSQSCRYRIRSRKLWWCYDQGLNKQVNKRVYFSGSQLKCVSPTATRLSSHPWYSSLIRLTEGSC